MLSASPSTEATGESEPFIQAELQHEKGVSVASAAPGRTSSFQSRQRLRRLVIFGLALLALGLLLSVSAGSQHIEKAQQAWDHYVGRPSEPASELQPDSAHQDLGSEAAQRLPEAAWGQDGKAAFRNDGSGASSAESDFALDAAVSSYQHETSVGSEADAEADDSSAAAADEPADAAEEADEPEEYVEEHDSSDLSASESLKLSRILTRPAAPSLVPRPPPGQERFISYLPHSGFHNQRIALSNALLLGEMLNRTVLMPFARLGQAIPWKPKSRLQAVWEKEQKTTERIEHCLAQTGTGRDGEVRIAEDCPAYKDFVEISWSMLVDLNRTGLTVPVINRADLSKDWLTSSRGISITQDSIWGIQDRTSYDYKLYAAQQGLDELELPGTAGIDNYAYALPLSDLQTPEVESKRLLEFGSLYGSYRINLKGADERWIKLRATIEQAMVFSDRLLEDVSRQMEDLMGGQGQFIGLHLRVGDGAFRNSAETRMRNTLTTALRNVFRYRQSEANRLLDAISPQQQHIMRDRGERRHIKRLKGLWQRSQADEHDSWAELGADELEEDLQATEDMSDSAAAADALTLLNSIKITANMTHLMNRQADVLACARPLYVDSYMAPLNAHIYIATDAREPRSDPALAPFFALFPCAHVLSDFEELVPALRHLKEVYSAEEHLPLFRFLAPFLEGMTASRAVRVIGTSGSTFSRFVTSTLHVNYWPNKAEQDSAVAALRDGLREDVLRNTAPT